jgi:hypothetical protein
VDVAALHFRSSAATCWFKALTLSAHAERSRTPAAH